MRYVQGFNDGSGQDYVRDTETGKSVARTRWGCSCCESGPEEEQNAQAALITRALNVYEAVLALTVLTTTRGGGVVLGPQGWENLQAVVKS